MAAGLVSIFIIMELPYLRHLPGFHYGMIARILALIAAVVGFSKVSRSYNPNKDEPFVFGCGLIIFLHILTNNYVQHADFVSIAAWDIAATFAIYSLVPIGLHYQVALAFILSLGSQYLWFTIAGPEISIIEILATPLAYIAANCFGINLSLNLNRIQRQEFEHLENEKKLRVDLEQTMNARDQLFSVLAHDLRGPIGALSEIGKLLDSTNPIDIKQREKLINLLCVGSKTSYDLLDNLLNWALSETGKLEPQIKQVDLQNSIESNIDLLAASANNKNIQLATDSSQRLSIQADPKMLDTILRNLIANAIKFTCKGGRIIILQSLAPDQTVNITIEDNGIGIEPNRLDHLFNLGFDDTSRGTEGEHGSNLGLRIVSDFTAKQGGSISVTSKKGEGTKITLSFPLSVPQAN